MRFYDKSFSRCLNWIKKSMTLCVKTFFKELKTELEKILDSYEMEVLTPKYNNALKEALKTIDSQCLYKNYCVNPSILSYDDFIEINENARKVADLLKRLSEMRVYASSNTNNLKEMERVLFANDEETFRKMFAKIAGFIDEDEVDEAVEDEQLVLQEEEKEEPIAEPTVTLIETSSPINKDAVFVQGFLF